MKDIPSPTRSHLALVSDRVPEAAPGPRSAPAIPRCRPSELPTAVLVELDEATAARLRQRARATGLPFSLWLRLATESVRQLRRAAAILGVPAEEVVRRLDAAAAQPVGFATAVSAGLVSYGLGLSRGVQAERSAGTTIRVEIPDELETAWSLEAAQSGRPLGAWVAAQAIDAPDAVAEWERAAARRGCYLGEWVLLEAASAQRSSTRPQR